jgi:hypothetical protein
VPDPLGLPIAPSRQKRSTRSLGRGVAGCHRSLLFPAGSRAFRSIMSYDLRRVRPHGLIARQEGTNYYSHTRREPHPRLLIEAAVSGLLQLPIEVDKGRRPSVFDAPLAQSTASSRLQH